MNSPDFAIVIDENELVKAGFSIITKKELAFEEVTSTAFDGNPED